MQRFFWAGVAIMTLAALIMFIPGSSNPSGHGAETMLVSVAFMAGELPPPLADRTVEELAALDPCPDGQPYPTWYYHRYAEHYDLDPNGRCPLGRLELEFMLGPIDPEKGPPKPKKGGPVNALRDLPFGLGLAPWFIQNNEIRTLIGTDSKARAACETARNARGFEDDPIKMENDPSLSSEDPCIQLLDGAFAMRRSLETTP